jgi:hypothetical protein
VASAEPQVLGLQLTRIQDVVIGRYISAVTLSQLQHDRERFRTAVSCLATSLPHSALG